MTKHTLRFVLALLVVAFAALPQRSSQADQGAPSLHFSRDLLRSSGVVSRWLRPDFESPDVLVLAYDSDWGPALKQILAATAGKIQVALAPVREDVDHWELKELAARPGVVLLDSVLDTSWVRDFAPLELRDAVGQVYWYDFPYSDERPDDDAFPERIAQQWEARYERAWFPMDGGGIISNGQGLCGITEDTLLQTNLSPTSQTDSTMLLEELGCDSLVIVPELPNEDTGHVDMIAQFVSPTSLIVGSTNRRVYPEVARVLDEAANRFARAGRKLGVDLTITRVPYEVNGTSHLTYVNGTALDGMFLVPRYRQADPAIERRAYRMLRRAMPNRRLIRIDADAMIDRGGSVHCITAGLNLEVRRGPALAVLPRPKPLPAVVRPTSLPRAVLRRLPPSLR